MHRITRRADPRLCEQTLVKAYTRSAMALLEETAFRNSVEAIFLANIGSSAMALTCRGQCIAR
jgi:hypothetical protein